MSQDPYDKEAEEEHQAKRIPVTMSQRVRIANAEAIFEAQELNREYIRKADKRMWAGVGAALGAILTGYIAMRSEVLAAAKDRTDAGTAVLVEQVKSLDIRTRRTEDRVERVEKMVEGLARKLRVDVPEPVKDGGAK